MNATCYHIRNSKGEKILGGTIGMSNGIDLNLAADRIVKEHDMIVTNSGRVSFAKNGAEVFIYLSVDPSETDKGKKILKEWHAERAKKLKEEEEERLDKQSEELNEALEGIGIEKAIEILKSFKKT